MKKAKLPRTLDRFPQKKEWKQVTSYTIDGIRIKERKKEHKVYNFTYLEEISEHKILINNIIFTRKSIKNLLPPIFKNCFIFCSNIHNYDTVSSLADKLFKPLYRTDSYGKKNQLL